MTSLVVFNVGGHAHAVEARVVVEIAPAVTVTPLAGSPASVEGIVDYHGKVIPVVDARRALGEAVRPPLLSDHLIILLGVGGTFALHVDRVVDLVDVAEERMARVETGDGVRVEAVKLDLGLTLLREVGELLSSEDARRVEEALAG